MPALLRTCLAGTLLVAAAPALSDDPFNGTWKGDLSSATVAGKPTAIVLSGGTFDCSSCTPSYKVAADGAFHPVKGKDYWDSTAITVIDDHNVRQEFRKEGKVVGGVTQTVSADGRTLTFKGRDTNNATAIPVEATTTETRLTDGPKGSHLISGTWKQAPATSVSDVGMTMTLAVTGDMLMLKNGMGETLNAKFGGPYAPNVGDPGKTMTKVVRTGPRSMRMTDMRGGKIVGISDYMVSADGGSITGQWRDPRNGDSGTFKADKQ